jgi:hypothetical protein
MLTGRRQPKSWRIFAAASAVSLIAGAGLWLVIQSVWLLL